MLRVISPIGSPVIEGSQLAGRLTTLEGATIGLLANGKPNAANLLRVVERALAKRHRIAGAVFHDKHSLGLNANNTVPDWVVGEFMKCDLVLHSSGD